MQRSIVRHHQHPERYGHAQPGDPCRERVGSQTAPARVAGQEFLRRDLLPDRRVVVRFDFSFLGRRTRGWMLVERREVELCRFDPGFGDDLVVPINDPLTFARRARRSPGLPVTRWRPAARPRP
jgi:hypothetical protein